MTDVFISYSRKDREFMRTLYERLQQSQRDVWVDWEDIPPSAEWLREIEQAIEAADAFGSTSMKRSLIATGVAAVSLLAFFLFVWEFL